MVFVQEDDGADEEDGCDQGGPRREFFRLFMEAAMHDSGLLEGKPNIC